MEILYKMFSFLRRYWPLFYPLEKRMLDTIFENFPDELKDCLKKQIDSINLVQRHSMYKEVNFYRIQKGKASFEKSIRLPFEQEEYKFCEIFFGIPDCDVEYRVDVWIVSGFLFSLAFNLSPQKILKFSHIVIKRIEILKQEKSLLNQDNQLNIADVLYLERIFSGYTVSGVQSPVEEKKRQSCLRMLHTQLPDDYRQLVSYSDGFEICNWIVHGSKTIRHAVDINKNYYVLAESDENCYLLVEDGSNSGEIYFKCHDEGPVKVGRSFIEVIKHKLNEGKGK